MHAHRLKIIFDGFAEAAERAEELGLSRDAQQINLHRAARTTQGIAVRMDKHLIAQRSEDSHSLVEHSIVSFEQVTDVAGLFDVEGLLKRIGIRVPNLLANEHQRHDRVMSLNTHKPR